MGNNRTLVVAGVAAALWLLWGRKAMAAHDASKNLTGHKVDRHASWSGSTENWAQTRFAAAFQAAKEFGESDEGTARQIALSMLTHWSIETGAGAAEWNFNVGNITATGSEPYYIAKDISGNVYAFRAFDSLADGVAAYISLLKEPRYHAAAAALASTPEQTDWFIDLGKAGWFDPTKSKTPRTWEQAASDYAARRALLAQYATK